MRPALDFRLKPEATEQVLKNAIFAGIECVA
jgi:hypothetical protein